MEGFDVKLLGLALFSFYFVCEVYLENSAKDACFKTIYSETNDTSQIMGNIRNNT